MKRHFCAIAACILIFSFLLTSCSSDVLFRPVDSLLAPPLYYEEYEELVEAFYKSVGEDVALTHPGKGEHRSAIIVEDVDSDGESEALVFYRNSKDGTSARMHFLDFIDGRWISDGDFNGYGNSVESIKITDMDNDGSFEFMVMWAASGVSTGSIMSIYRSPKNVREYKEISNEACSISEIVDIDGDGKKEVFFVAQSNAAGGVQRTAKAMRISGDSVKLIGETRIDPNISSYTSIKTEKSSDKEPMKIYIDALKGESQMITEIIYWDKNESVLCAPLFDTETMSTTATLRHEPVACADINNDGVIDIPVQSKIFGKGDSLLTADTEDIYLTEWKNYTSNGLKPVENTLINYSDGYMIHLDAKETESTGIRNYRSQNCWVVYRTDASGESTGEIYSVLKILADKWDSDKFSAYIPISEKDDSVVCVYVTQTGKDIGIDEEFIKSKITRIPS